jgi:hypothetical protein
MDLITVSPLPTMAASLATQPLPSTTPSDWLSFALMDYIDYNDTYVPISANS